MSCFHEKWDHSFPAACTQLRTPFYPKQAPLKGLEGERYQLLWDPTGQGCA